MLATEFLLDFSESVLKDIIQIGHDSFPVEWFYDDADEYYSQMLKNKKNIHILLKDDKKNVGYLLAIPHDLAVEELMDCDPAMQKDDKKFYIETLSILPGFRGKGGLPLLLGTLSRELRKRGIYGISLHARVTNKLSQRIQRNMNVTKVRRIEKWKYYNFEEPADYLEVNLD